MGGVRTLVGTLAREAIAKHPKAASRTLAKMLYRQSPEIFTSVEQARNAIRVVRGARGTMLRGRIIDQLPRSKAEAEECQQWGALLPDAEPTEWGWRELPSGVKRWLILADIHLPYYDKAALTVALEHADGNCDGILLLGDVVDAYQLSSFCRDPRRRNFEGEIDAAKQLLDALDKMPVKAKVWKAGNHEVRLERYLMQRAPELWPSLADRFSFRTILDLDDRGITWIRAQDPIRHHQLAILHGHEWGHRFSSPVNAARGAFLKAHECTLEGHTHRSSYHAETTLFGTTIRCWSIGALCDMHPEYHPLGNKWDSGLAYLTTGSEWSIENHTIIDGKVL